ncbi:hypothetical protein EI290_02080 [Hymenobacter metallilatus]|uniref:Uncharacterized protein n=2 Tax=Hymenobacter metallilatus TaxID=2493666 RepID=A0A428JTW1_9BACT|nr:hypothetical protein EI290_02080 [Hymenobacter metallilatus]
MRRLTTNRTFRKATYVDSAALQGEETIVRGSHTILQYSVKTNQPRVAHSMHVTSFWLTVPSINVLPIGTRITLPDSRITLRGYTFGGGMFGYDFPAVTGSVKRKASTPSSHTIRLRLRYLSRGNRKQRLNRRVTFLRDSTFFARKEQK